MFIHFNSFPFEINQRIHQYRKLNFKQRVNDLEFKLKERQWELVDKYYITQVGNQIYYNSFSNSENSFHAAVTFQQQSNYALWEFPKLLGFFEYDCLRRYFFYKSSEDNSSLIPFEY